MMFSLRLDPKAMVPGFVIRRTVRLPRYTAYLVSQERAAGLGVEKLHWRSSLTTVYCNAERLRGPWRLFPVQIGGDYDQE